MKNLILISFLTLLGCSIKQKQFDGVKFEYDSHILINVQINDSIKGLFIFDTGADGLYLDSDFISKHSKLVKSSDTATIGGAGNEGDQKIVIITNSIKITVGNQSMDFDTIPVLNLRPIVNRDIAGILGNDFIKNGILSINNTDTTISVDTSMDLTKYQNCLSFSYEDGRIFIKPNIVLPNTKTLTPKLMIDLGCADAIIFNSGYYQTFSSDIKNHIDYSVLDGGVSGNSEGGEFRLKDFEFGGVSKSSMIACFSSDTLGAHSSSEYDGLLGNGFLERFDYLIDYKNNKIYFNKNKRFKEPYFSTKSGINAVKEDDYAFVKCIYYQFDGSKQGLNLGDTIIEINHKPTANLSQKQINKMLEDDKSDLQIKFKSENQLKDIIIKTGQKI